MPFKECVLWVLDNDDFMVEYDRLHGTHFRTAISPLENLIDQATNKLDEDARELFRFILRYIWLPAMRDEQAAIG
jgi:hypothetical protein